MNKLTELLEYQNKEEELRKIRQNIANTEDYKKYIQARKFLEKAPESLQVLDSKAVNYQKDFVAIQEKLNALSEKLTELEEPLEDNNILSEDISTSEKNYYEKSIKKNVDALKNLKQDYKKLEEVILATETEYKTLGKTHKEMKKQFDEYKEKYATITKGYQDTISSLEKELKALGDKLENNNDFKKYKSKREEKIFPVICTVIDNRCSCCSMQLSLDTLTKLEQGVECESCGRILYKK